MTNCWDIKKKCPFRDTDRAEAKCPAYADQVSCWNFDWMGFYRGMPDGPEKAEWKRIMLKWCSIYEIRESHPREVDSFLARLTAA